MRPDFKVLLIDDDRILQALLSRVLRGDGAEVILASDGPTGLQQARLHRPELVLCDWCMEGMDGLEVCRHFKSDPELAPTFFVLLTSRSSVEDRVKGLDCGADDFLCKPVEPSELLARVRAGLRLFRVNHELRLTSQKLAEQQRLLDKELTLAADYVRSILPPPMAGSLAITSAYQPSQKLGGDCFDFYDLDAEHVILYMLDVSGHGLAAALPSISIHNLLRTFSRTSAILFQPDEVLRYLNSVFQMERHEHRFFTMWYGIYNRTTRQLSYASAGHPPALLVSCLGTSSPRIDQLTTRGMPIGLFESSHYERSSITIEPMACLYVFTDGIYELVHSDGSVGNYEAFVSFMEDQVMGSECEPDQLLNRMLDDSGSSDFPDDCSMLRACFSAS